jgi:hypothetical protein
LKKCFNFFLPSSLQTEIKQLSFTYSNTVSLFSV